MKALALLIALALSCVPTFSQPKANLTHSDAYRTESVTSLSTPAMVWSRAGKLRASPLIIINHAAGQTERQFAELPQFRVLLRVLLKRGYVVAASRLGDNPDSGFFNWGNTGALNANYELYGYVTSRYAIDTERVGMIGNSMGGLTTLLAFPDGRIPVKCAALYYPVTSLHGQYQFNAQMGFGINVAYGINPDGSNFSARTNGHDPQTRHPRDWAGARLRFYGGDEDSVVPWHMHGGAFAARVSSEAIEAGVVELKGDHNADVETTVDDLSAFFDRCFK